MADDLAGAMGTMLPTPGGADGAGLALVVVDDECRVVEASFGACRLLDLARDDTVGRPLAELLVPESAEHLRGIWGAFHRDGGHAGPFELAGSASRMIDVSVTAAVLPGRHLVALSPQRPMIVPPGAADVGVDGSETRMPTNRERQILAMLASGDTDVRIASKLELSPATVQTHVRNAKAKLGARTRTQAVAMAMRRGMIQPG